MFTASSLPPSAAERPPEPVPDGARATFERALRRALGQPAHVVWTRNRVRLASGTRRGGLWSVRLHGLFAGGGEAEARALADVLARRPAAAASGARLRVWFAEAQARAGSQAEVRQTRGAVGEGTKPATARPRWRPTAALPQPADPPSAHVAPAPPRIATPESASAGLLAELFAELNAAYFHNGCRASIRWGRGGTPARRRRRSMQLGCYDFSRGEIRIHPALAEPYVPRYVVALVVYHEMLHEVFGLTRHNGRHLCHPPEFAVCEQSHPDYLRARAWEKQHLGRLLAWRA